MHKNETIEHTLDKCDSCGEELKKVNVVKSDIIDFDVEVKKKK